MNKFSILAFILFLLSLTAHQVSAETVGELLRNADRGESSEKIKKKKTEIPLTKESVAKKRKPVDLSKVKPLKTPHFLVDASDDKAELEKITDEQIQELYKLTQKFKNSARRGELWLRLAELYVEKSGLIDFRRQAIYDKKLQEYQDGKTKSKPRINEDDAKDYNKKALQLYEWFIRDFPKDDKIDQALFFLGYNNFELGNIKKGLSYYDRLLKEHPKSSYITESHFALAEYYFENEKWKPALEHYQEVLRHRKHRLYAYSTYKLAWCYYRTGKSSLALKTMEKIVRDSQDNSKVHLEKEGTSDIVLFFADEGDVKKAIPYFTNLAGKDADTYLEKLAYIYTDKGNYEGAKTLFNYLIQKNPTSAKAYDYKYQLIQVLSYKQKTKEYRDELFSWTKQFGPSGDWYEANKGNASLIENSNRLREITLKNWILSQHKIAQTNHSKINQTQAGDGYKLFLSEFPTSTAIADMHFFYAELLYDMGRFDEAGVHYKWVVDNAANSKYGSKAAENIILSFERGIPQDQEIAAVVGKTLDAVRLGEKAEKFIEAADWYLGKFPNSKKVTEIKFRVGRLYYQYNQFDKATPYFKDIVKMYPKTKYAEYSANLLLDTYNLKKDYAGLENAGKELLAVKSISNSTAGTDIRGVIEKSQFKKAQDLELDKKYQDSAEAFELFGKQNPKSPLAGVAYFNAAINFERAGQNQKAIENHLRTLAAKGKEAVRVQPKSRQILAKLYQDMGLLEEASRYYKISAKEAGNDLLAANLFYNAAAIDEALGRNSDAIENYELYFSKSKKSDRTDVIYEIAQIHRKAGQLKQATNSFKEYFDLARPSEKAVEAAYWVYEYNRDQRKAKETEIWKKKTLQLQKRLSPNHKGIGAEWAAKILLYDSTIAFYEMRNIAIPADPAKQKIAAQKKIGLLNNLNEHLAQIIKYNSAEEIIGALSLSGRANLHMGEALVNAPIPKGLRKDEIKAYKAGIEKIASPFLLKAKESFKTAVDRGSELEAYGKDYSYALEMLKKLSPAVVDHGEISFDVYMGAWMSFKAQNDETLVKEATSLLAQNPKNEKALNALGMSQYRKGHPLAAQLFFSRALQAQPKNADLHNNLGLTYLAMKLPLDALKSFKKALEYDSDNMNAAANLGAIYLQYRDFNKAYLVMDMALKNRIREYTNEAKIYSNYAVACAWKGKLSQAKGLYTEALDYSRNNREILFNYAIFQIMYQKKFKEGLDTLGKLKMLGPGDSMRSQINVLENHAKTGVK